MSFIVIYLFFVSGFSCSGQLVSYRGVSFQLANLPEKASWKLAPRVNSHLPLAYAFASGKIALCSASNARISFSGTSSGVVLRATARTAAAPAACPIAIQEA